tara:strand:+ start:1869 stop:2420 length:552 start_codon:yes stop_codon:yes gene_type:complete
MNRDWDESVRAVHVAVTREVKHGCEADFEAALKEFARESLHFPGTTGVHLIEPIPGTNGCEFGILRSFEDEASSRRFYDSSLFQQWNQRVADLVVGEPNLRRLTGLEAFFRDFPRSPPRWKMAFVTWLGVYPSVLLWSAVLPKLLSSKPYLFVVAIVCVFVVATLAWIVMPLLTRILASWLHE